VVSEALEKGERLANLPQRRLRGNHHGESIMIQITAA
jgi:hypothetical protein